MEDGFTLEEELFLSVLCLDENNPFLTEIKVGSMQEFLDALG